MKKKYLVHALLVACSLLVSSSAHALFTNGGFELGNYTGWTVTYGNVYTNITSSPDWSEPNTWSRWYTGAPYPVAQIVTASMTYPGQTIDVNPYNGTYMAYINDIGGDYDATRLTQTATIAADDIGDTLYVNWGAMLVDPQHPQGEQPYFHIDVLKNGSVIDSFSADATDAASSGWAIAGSDGYSPLYYKAGQYTYNLSGFNVSDTITVDMFVTDCGYGGHGGYAFLDGIGTEYVPPPPGTVVPEPCTMILFGTGIAGAAGFLRKRSKKS
ncbi:MAG: PEP-CTERM sorting domain-containing protein [Desulfovibrionales bacterium]|nr:PEP-CTERM sorting domain-containing protein [Desulfovibrionales bacterium]